MHKKYFGEEITNMHCVGHFIVLMIIKNINVIASQTMHCILCHNNPILNVKIQKFKLGKD
jgi:hypothetical protein